MAKRLYVAGFCFSPELQRVVLIEKTKPKWQKGKLNGVGGKIEPEEHPIDAMVREFYEETGVIIPAELWTQFATISNDDWIVFFYKTVSDKVDEVRTTTEEHVNLFDLEMLHSYNTVPNLQWLIPMALQGDVLMGTILYNNDGT